MRSFEGDATQDGRKSTAQKQTPRGDLKANGLDIFQQGRCKLINGYVYIVDSYTVNIAPKAESCECKPWGKRHKNKKDGHSPCQHMWATYFEMEARGGDPSGLPVFSRGNTAPAGTLGVSPDEFPHVRAVASQRYGKSKHTRASRRCEEWEFRAAELLRDLCITIDPKAKPPRTDARGKRTNLGAPDLKLEDILFGLVWKTLKGHSYRSIKRELHGFVSDGLISKAPHFNSMCAHQGEKWVLDVLKAMFARTVTPFRNVEKIVAADATEFSTQPSQNYCDAKYGGKKSKKSQAKRAVVKPLLGRDGRPSRWGKPRPRSRNKRVHGLSGMETGALLAITVTDTEGKGAHETQQLEPLLKAAAQNNCTLTGFVGDGAYQAEEIFAMLKKMGIEFSVRVKRNWNPETKTQLGTAVAEQIKAENWFDNPIFRGFYGYRVRIEGVWSMIKALFGHFMRVKSPIQKLCEIYCKAIAYNLRKIAHHEIEWDTKIDLVVGTAFQPRFEKVRQSIRRAA